MEYRLFINGLALVRVRGAYGNAIDDYSGVIMAIHSPAVSCQTWSVWKSGNRNGVFSFGIKLLECAMAWGAD